LFALGGHALISSRRWCRDGANQRSANALCGMALLEHCAERMRERARETLRWHAGPWRTSLFLHQHLPLLTPPHHWMTLRKGMLSLHHVSIAEQWSFFLLHLSISLTSTWSRSCPMLSHFFPM
jgi:hypothetical protein